MILIFQSSFRGRTMFAPTIQSLNFTNRQKKRLHPPPAFSFAEAGAKEKAIKKKTPMGRFRALRSATVAADGSRRLLKKAGENFCRGARNFIGVRYEKRKSLRISFFVFTYCRGLYAPRGDSLSYRKRRRFFRPPARRYQPFSYSAPHKGHASA